MLWLCITYCIVVEGAEFYGRYGPENSEIQKKIEIFEKFSEGIYKYVYCPYIMAFQDIADGDNLRSMANYGSKFSES